MYILDIHDWKCTGGWRTTETSANILCLFCLGSIASGTGRSFETSGGFYTVPAGKVFQPLQVTCGGVTMYGAALCQADNSALTSNRTSMYVTIVDYAGAYVSRVIPIPGAPAVTSGKYIGWWCSSGQAYSIITTILGEEKSA